jgi:H+/Cl- antiporter ClcA
MITGKPQITQLLEFCDNINELDLHLADKLELFDEKYTSLLPFKKRMSRYLRYLDFKQWVCIFLVAVLAGLNGYVCDAIGGNLFAYRLEIVQSTSSVLARYLIWTGITTACALSATYLCDKYSKEAEGSGVPEIKTYLSGLRISQYVSLQSYFIKLIGLILMDTSGFFIGKEGPFIQMSTMIAKLIGNLAVFEKMNRVIFLTNF